MGEYRVEVAVTLPNGAHIEASGWFPHEGITDRAMCEFLVAAAENVKSRVLTLGGGVPVVPGVPEDPWRPPRGVQVERADLGDVETWTEGPE